MKYDIGCSEGHVTDFKNILDNMASVYSDHPDYIEKPKLWPQFYNNT